ncbi:DNA gyrase inhibitor YacG [Robiginitomaculum antarcticum]|uniref:DNA gyrase inhibitor YacG n=1 Tax=Robiginitomaculum antarcticum TaxID=437507 RepID=UPI000366706E|nr:DNA gyrase inhibitor YacG [Robiginitomaculum antarcticum]
MTENAAKCPVCKNPAHEAFAPFCSKRCADVDLHRWMSGRYAIKGQDGEAAIPANDTGKNTDFTE